MTPERRQQIKLLFHAVRERTAEQRVAYLDEACQGDTELRQEVASLLLAYDQLDGFMQQPLLAGERQSKEFTAEQTVLAVGQMVRHYRIERQLGAGGMGVVYLAHDTNLRRPVTLKLLQSRFTQDRDRMRRFQQEARAASALNHPNLLTIYEVGQAAEAGGAYYIVAEFVAGKTLRELFREDAMQLGEVLDVAIQMTDAIAAAHQAGIVHRDIKPENIMLRPDGIVKVLDFGLAKLTEQKGRRGEGERERKGEGEKGREGEADATFATPSPLPHSSSPPLSTEPGLVLGTVAYMSPEQARGVEVDARSDLFSVGVVLYEMLSGRKPFQGETPSDVLAALLEREPPPLNYYVSGLPNALEQIVNCALAKAPQERYQSAQEFGAALKQLRQELEFAAHLNRSASQDNAPKNPLTMKVGASALGDEVTRVLVPSAGRKSSPSAFSLRWQGRSKQAALVAAALLLLMAGLLVGRYWWSARADALNSVAVLPFLNVGNDPQMEYLPDAITENLIDSLTRLPALRVSARNTVFSYKGREVDPCEAGKALQVRAVVTGRVWQQGERLIIRVELVDTSDGARLWGDEFQHARANILTLQEAIAREIAAKLHRRLNADNQQQLAKRHSADGRAYELYAQGRYLYLQYNRKSQEQALDYFRQAIALAPNYALAYCGMADVYADFSSQYMLPSEAIPKAREAALKAIELDETLSEAHHSLALVKLWGDWDWAGAEREYKRALELNPNFVLTRIYYAELLTQQKRFEEALREIKRAEEYDPGSTQAMLGEGSIYFSMRQYDRAIVIYRNVLELSPEHSGAQRALAVALSQKGLHQEALAQMIPLQTPTASASQISWLAYLFARAGQRPEAQKLLRELETRARRERVSPLYFVRVSIGLGDKESSFVWLRKGYEEQSDHLLHIGSDPICDPLRSDPRFVKLVRRIGLAP